MTRLRLLLMMMLLSILTAIIACRKSDWQTRLPQSDAERFFHLQSGSQPAVQRAVGVLREAEKQQPFVETIAQKLGWPLWDKAQLQYHPTARGSDTILLVPLVPDGSRRVHAVLELRLSTNMLLRIFGGDDHKNYPSGTLWASTASAERFAVEFMKIEHRVFGYRQFVIKADSLFQHHPIMRGQFRKINIVPAAANSTALVLASADCYEVEIWYDPDGDADPGHNSGNEYFTGETYLEGNCGSSSGGGYPGGFGIFSGGSPVVVSGWTTNTPTTGSGPGWVNWPPYHPPQGWTPSYVDDAPWPNPCMVIDTLLKNSTFKTLMGHLYIKCTDRFETGFLIKNIHSPAPASSSVVGTPNTLSIDFSTNDTVDCILHNHYIDSASLSIFSSDDLFTIWDFFHGGQTQDPASFTMGLVTFRTSYLLMITDTAKFRNFGNKFLTNRADDRFINQWFYITYGISEKASISNNEYNFLRALTGLNCGLTLIRGNESMTSFKPIRLSADGKSVEEVKCK
jgi:hypothetical protein